ncbi:MAG: cupin domain-containing protein [Myxococcota bacterium]
MPDPAVVHRFTDTFVHLGHDERAVPLPVTESFWPDLMAGKLDHLGPGRLATFYEFTENWDSWEAHPAGEELVCLVSGHMELLLDRGGEPERVALREPGDFVLVPKGAWHTADVLAPSRALFVTAGAGTTHRPR